MRRDLSASNTAAAIAVLAKLGKVGSWLAAAIGFVIAAAIGLAVLVWGVVAILGILPIIVFVGFVLGLAVLFSLEASPFPASRFAIALVAGLLAERIIFWFATNEHLYRPAGAPIIYALSIVCGYTVWRLLSPAILESDANIKALPGVAGLIVAFPTFYLAVLVLEHFFPWLRGVAAWFAQFNVDDGY